MVTSDRLAGCSQDHVAQPYPLTGIIVICFWAGQLILHGISFWAYCFMKYTVDSRQNSRAYSIMELHPINRGKEVISANQFMLL